MHKVNESAHFTIVAMMSFSLVSGTVLPAAADIPSFAYPEDMLAAKKAYVTAIREENEALEHVLNWLHFAGISHSYRTAPSLLSARPGLRRLNAQTA